MKKIFNKNSLKFQILYIFVVIWIILFGAITLYSHFTQKILLSEIKSTNQNMLVLYAAQLDSLCTEVNRCLANTMNETDFNSPEFDTNSFSQELATDILLYDNRFSFFYSNPQKNQYIFQTASNITLSEREEFSQHFYALDSKCSSKEWEVLTLDKKTYL